MHGLEGRYSNSSPVSLAQIAVAGLGDRSELDLAAGSALRRHQAEPGGEPPSVIEAGGVPDGGDRRAGDDRPELGDGGVSQAL